MQCITSAVSRRRSLWLAALNFATLTSLTLAAPALERKAAIQPRTEPPKQLPLAASPKPVQWQLDQLRTRIQELEGRVAALQVQVQQQWDAGSNLAARLAALEDAVQVGSNTLRLQSPGAVEIEAAGVVTLRAAGTITLAGSKVDLNSPHLLVRGTAQSEQVVTKSVVSESYTPGAGNVW